MRLALQYLLNSAVGKANAVPLRQIVTHLRRRGVNITATGFQQTILAESRDRDYFIGSSRHGYYLIDTVADAREMQAFYRRRLRAEQCEPLPRFRGVKGPRVCFPLANAAVRYARRSH